MIITLLNAQKELKAQLHDSHISTTEKRKIRTRLREINNELYEQRVITGEEWSRTRNAIALGATGLALVGAGVYAYPHIQETPEPPQEPTPHRQRSLRSRGAETYESPRQESTSPIKEQTTEQSREEFLKKMQEEQKKRPTYQLTPTEEKDRKKSLKAARKKRKEEKETKKNVEKIPGAGVIPWEGEKEALEEFEKQKQILKEYVQSLPNIQKFLFAQQAILRLSKLSHK